MTVRNDGQSSARSVVYAIDEELANNLAIINAAIKSGEEDQKLSATKANQQGKVTYSIELAEPLQPGKELTIDVETIFPHSLTPYPSKITQAEKQLVQFKGNVYFYSPYKTLTQTTTVTLASDKVESYTDTIKPVSKTESKIIYGPYENKDAYSQELLNVHSENNSPFLTVTELDRLIEVSHWGNIAVEETVDIRHTGALLKGPFSRYEYQRNQDGISSVKAFKTVLPSSARDVYYRDEIGNISTSNMREQDDMVEVELRPRFPLFGGWKTHYTLGYNVPSYQYLYNNGDQYKLKMRFVDHIYDDQIVDHMTLRVILPEGVSNVKLIAPYDVKRGADEKHYTYLDTAGRTVVVASKSDLVDAHIQDFELHYTFNKVMMLQEPLLVIGAFYLLFLSVIIYVRLDFSITKDEASESRLRVAGLVEQIQGIQDRRSALYQSYDDQVNKLKSSKDQNTFTANKKRIDGDYKSLTQQIQGLLSKLKAEGSDMAEKIGELQKLDAAVKEQINLSIQVAEKLLSGKISKQIYLEHDGNIKSKKDELCQKMDTLLNSF